MRILTFIISLSIIHYQCIESQYIDNRTRANHRFKFRVIGKASSSGLRNSFAARTVGDCNQLPVVVVEQESPTAFKNQLDRLAMP